jgi:hypothetical protein
MEKDLPTRREGLKLMVQNVANVWIEQICLHVFSSNDYL